MITINKEDDGSLSISFVRGMGLEMIDKNISISCQGVGCRDDNCPAYNKGDCHCNIQFSLKQQREYISSKLPIKQNKIKGGGL